MVLILIGEKECQSNIEDFKKITKHYGIEEETLQILNKEDQKYILLKINKFKPKVIVIHQSAIRYLKIIDFYYELCSINNYFPTIYFIGLSVFSNKYIYDISNANINSINELHFGQIRNINIYNGNGISNEMNGQIVEVNDLEINCCFFKLKETSGSQILIEFQGDYGNNYPTFISFKFQTIHIFLTPHISTVNFYNSNILNVYKGILVKYYSFLVVLKKTYKEEMFQYTELLANFTIDDPWLKKEYGYLNFQSLLYEMKRRNFHTTIAFIPWNYKRNKKETVEIFKKNPDYYSLCIHGNNHDRREFYRYQKSKTKLNHYQTKSFSNQEYNVKEALIRSQKMTENTGLEVEKVMVFPHGISPKKTLGALKRNGYLSTTNVNNIPLDEPSPQEIAFYLDTTTLIYENFPSIRRFSAEVLYRKDMKWCLNFLMFLGCPLIFHTHHQFFKSGINRFNAVVQSAYEINKKIKWKSLGYISKKLYKVKKINNDHYLVLMLSDEISIKNEARKNLNFSIVKYINNDEEVESVYINNECVKIERKENELKFDSYLISGEKKDIKITYKCSNNEVKVKKFLIIRSLIFRLLCDIRDNLLK